MDSPQSVVSPFKSSSVFAESEKVNGDLFVKSPDCLSNGFEVQKKEDFLGILEIYIHQARDIHNICIYHKQDVYAKLCLTSDPDNTVSTKIINGGGKNPVFNDNLQLNVRTISCSLKCEVWMLSRVKNYLEDQLLGFALVPLSEVLIKNGKLEKEFSLSSTDLFHSPAGFVQLSLSYSGAFPEVIAIPAPPPSVVVHDLQVPEVLPSEFENIEFPDPKIINENDMMVSEYFGIPCTNLDSGSSESLLSSDTENHLNSESGGIHIFENFSTSTVDSVQLQKHDSPPSSLSTNGSTSASLPASSESSEAQGSSKSLNRKEKTADVGDDESDASGGMPSYKNVKPVVTVNIPEQKVVQQDIVDMYMKSMQQFTESLAKMKVDMESEPNSSGNSTSDQKLQASKTTGSRVFYGSRAFF